VSQRGGLRRQRRFLLNAKLSKASRGSRRHDLTTDKTGYSELLLKEETVCEGNIDKRRSKTKQGEVIRGQIRTAKRAGLPPPNPPAR